MISVSPRSSFSCEKTLPRVALTLGEPAGIGPDICLQLGQHDLPAQVVIIGSPELLMQRARTLGLSLQLETFDPRSPPQKNGKGTLSIVPVDLLAPCVPGELNVKNSPYVLTCLRKGFDLCSQRACDALVTAPVHKAILSKVDPSFKGHTEFFARAAGVDHVLMTFYTPTLITGLVTTHCALKDINQFLTSERFEHAIRIFYEGLTTLFKKQQPQIGICGLNPHAGEDGSLGKEEQTILIPVIKTLQQQGFQLEGPLPADTIFSPHQRARFEGILAMYHDQGLAPMKALFFGEIVNVTLGLPFLRTSVDHGTALTLAGTGKADPSSLLKALHLTTQWISTQETALG